MNSDYSTAHSLITSLREDCSWDEIAEFFASVMSDVNEEEILAEEEEENCGCGCDPSTLDWDDLFTQIILPWTAANIKESSPLSEEEISALSTSTLDFLREALCAVAAVRKISTVTEEKKDTVTSALSLLEKIFNR